MHNNFFAPPEPSSTSTNHQTTKPTNIDKAWQAFLKSTKKDIIQGSSTTSTTIQEDIKRYRSLATKLYVLGIFDEDKRPRDYVPDKLVTRLVMSLNIYRIARTAGRLFLSRYDCNVPHSIGHSI